MIPELTTARKKTRTKYEYVKCISFGKVIVSGALSIEHEDNHIKCYEGDKLLACISRMGLVLLFDNGDNVHI